MKRIPGFTLLLCGLAALTYGLVPWIQVSLMRPGRYHYYYLSEDARMSLYIAILVGFILAGSGVWMMLRTRPSK